LNTFRVLKKHERPLKSFRAEIFLEKGTNSDGTHIFLFIRIYTQGGEIEHLETHKFFFKPTT
jgi:hypothetical protein